MWNTSPEISVPLSRRTDILMTTRGGGLQKALDKNPAGESQDIPGVSPQKEFSDSTKKAAPYVVSAFLIIVGLMWTGIAPPTSYASPLYLLPRVALLVMILWRVGSQTQTRE